MVRIRGLTKTYGRFTAVRELSLAAQRGSACRRCQ
jgi:hypothetical protein